MEVTQIPRFRSAKRLVLWMERNWRSEALESRGGRLPPECERVFFKTKKEEPKEVAACVARYSGWVGRLEPEYEALVKGHNDSLVSYVSSLSNRELEVDLSLIEGLSGDSRNLYRVSKHVGRLPEHLEATITEARYAFLYAKEVLRGRLPGDMEQVFFGDSYHAAKYAFEVIRGFAPCRLPESLHNMMVMKSFEDPENEEIRTYIEAAESDPNRMGNSVERVR